MKTIVILAFACAVMSRADDWPQWRGANRDGVWRETGILESVPAAGLEVRWRAKIGNGYSGPVVAQERVFVTDHVFDPEVERVLCFDEGTGKQLWAHSYAVDYKDMEYGNGPRASPTIHDGKVYTFGTQGHLFCLEAATGGVVWEKNVAKDFSGTIPRYGASAAPLVAGELLIVCAGGQPDASVVALDSNTGELRWKALADRPAYSAPIVITAGGCEQVIVWTADSITAFDPPTGKVFWQVPRKSAFDPAEVVASPVLHKDMLLCMGAWNRGSVMLKLEAAKPGASVLWQTGSKPTTMISTPLFQDDEHFYAILGNGRLACLDADGKELWTSKEPTGPRSGAAHLTPNGDRVFLFNDTGHLILARLTRDGYRELGRALLVEPTAGYRAQGPLTWAHPAYANKCVFARNDRELVCASLAADRVVDVAAPQQTIKSRVPAGFPEGNAALAFSPDGKALAAGGKVWPAATKVIELASGKELPAPAALTDFICAVAFSPDGKLLVSAGGSEFTPARNGGKTTGQVKLLDVAAGKELAELTGHTNKVFTAVFSPDSKTLATGAADRTVRLWDVATMKTRAVLEGHADAVMSVAFSTDGKTIASASADRTVKLWAARTGIERANLKGHEDAVNAVAFSPDGKTVATGSADWTARLWDVATQKERAVLKGHGGGVLCLAISADGKTLASGSGDETVKLWEVATAKERATLRGHRSGISAVAFSPDDRTLASAGMNDAVRLWELNDKPWRALPLITDGKIDSAWAQVGWGGFVVDDGALRTECDERGMGLLLYKAEKFGNCQLRVVYRCEKPKSNAGVYVRLNDGIIDRIGEKSPEVHRDAKGKLTPEMLKRLEGASEKHLGAWYPVHHGYEVQIMDAADAFHRTGAIYSLAKAEPVPAKAQTEWRTMIIMLEGERISVEVDGKRISAFAAAASDLPPRVKWAEPIREIKRPTVGYIGLQNHDPGDVVWFKEVSVRLLAKPDNASGWMKSPRNPMLELGPADAFDSQNILAPTIAKEGGKYFLFYSGGPSGPKNGGKLVRYQLGLALSDDGATWTKTGRPLLPLGQRDDFHVTPALLRNAGGHLQKSGGLWHMVYCGNRADDVEHATSRDGLSWEKDPRNPIFKAAYAPNLVEVSGELRMYHIHKPEPAGGKPVPWEVHLATGSDFHSLTPHPANPVLQISQPWEKGALFYPYVLRENETWVMFYAAYWRNHPDGKGATAIGMATSRDGLHWTKSPANPVLTPTPGSAYDSIYTSSQSVLHDGDLWRLYYAGRVDTIHKYFSIGMASKTGRLVPPQ